MKKLNFFLLLVLLFTISSCDKISDSIPEKEGGPKKENNYPSKDSTITNVINYQEKSAEYILEDLAKRSIISTDVKDKLMSSISGKTAEEFKKEALARMAKYSSLRTADYYPPITPGPGTGPIIITDPIFSQMVFDHMTIDLMSRGISWGCAGAIAGIGLSIAGGLIGGPVTVAAAAIWGASHVLAVMSLTACAPSEKLVMHDISNMTLDQYEVTFYEGE